MPVLYDIQPTRQTRHGLVGLSIAGILLLIPIIVFWSVWSTYAVDVPKWDDQALKAFLFYLDSETTISGKLYQFFKQHNEHRIVYDRLITWLDFSLFGKLNYRHLMIVGNLSLVGLLAIFGLVFGRTLSAQSKNLSNQPSFSLTDCLIYLPPVAFLLLNLSQWENMFWGMAALQNFTVVLWIVGAIYALCFTQNLPLALLLAIAATLTSGNGILIWPIGFAILFHQRMLNIRAGWRSLLIWGIAAVGTITLYFVGYEKPAGNPPVRGTVFDLLKGWFAFNGAAAEAFPVGPVFVRCVLVGGIGTLLILGIWGFILKKWLSHKKLSPFDYFFVGVTAFLLGTAAIVAWSRVGFGLNTLITSRYKAYSLVLLAIFYSAAVVYTQASFRKWVLRIGLLFSIILMAGSYRAYQDETIWWRQWLLTNQFNWSYGKNQPVLALDPITTHYITNSPAFYDRVLPDLYRLPTGPLKPLSSMEKTNHAFMLIDTAAINPVGPDAGTYILLRSVKRLYLYQTSPYVNPSLKASLGLANLFVNGFSSSIAEVELEPGTYQIERLLVKPDGAIERYPTAQSLTATPQARRDIEKNW
ncbi:hypothetical protein [Spirosoma jeollabukense]